MNCSTLVSGVGDGQGSLACCSPWDCKESDVTERLNWTEVGDAIQPSHPLSSLFPPALNLSQHQGLFQCIRWPKYWSFNTFAAAAAKSLQLCPTLCDPRDSSPPGSPIPGILLARTLEWVAISFSNAWKWKVKVKSPSRVRLLATLGTVA